MNKSRKIISLLLALALILSLAACSSGDQGSTAPQQGSETEVTTGSDDGLKGEITFVAWGSDAEIACDEKACRAFEALHPGTTVKFEALNDSYSTTVETRYLGGQSPDVIYGHPQTLLTWMQNGMLMPITDVYDSHDELWDDSVFFTNLYDSYKFDGEYYAIPVGADTFVVYYNKTMFDAAGVPYPTKDTTWDEFAKMMEAVTERDTDGTPITVGLDGLTGYWQYILYSMGGKVLDNMNDPHEVVFESPEALKMLTWINDNYTEANGFYANDNDWTYLAGGFSGNEVGAFMDGVYDIVWLSGIEDFEWDIAPLPGTMSKEGDTPILYAGYAVSSKSDNPDLAKEFAYFMSSYDAQVIMAETGLITSCRKDVAYSDQVLNIQGGPANHRLRVDNIPYGQNVQGQCLCWWEITDVVSNEIYKMVHGEQTPQETMTAIQTQASALLSAELNK